MNKIIFDWIISINRVIPVVFGIAAFLCRFLFNSDAWHFYLILGFISLAIQIRVKEDN